MILPEQDRPARRVDLRIGSSGTVVVYPDGYVDLPAALNASARQVADELRIRGWLPPLPEVETTTVEEDHAYPCPTCGGAGWPCRTCRGPGELFERGDWR